MTFSRKFAIFALVAVVGTVAMATAPAHADDQAGKADVARALTLIEAGNATAARDAAVAAVRAAPRWGLAHAVHARTLVAVEDGVGAEAALARAFEGGFDRSRAQALLGEAQLLRGAPDRAVETLAKAPPAYAAYAARIRGRAYAAMGRGGDAAAAFAQSRRLNPADARLWTDIARHNHANGDIGNAIRAATRAVELDARQPETLRIRALLVREQFGLIAALPWFERALARDPQHHDTLIDYAATLGDAGRTIDMLDAVRRAMRARGNSSQGYYLQAVLAARAGDFATARSILAKAGSGVDAVPGAVMLAGVLDLEAGGHEQAIEKLRPLVARQPLNLNARRLLATAYLRADASRNAIQILAPAIARPDADSESLLLAARGYERIGDRVRAAQLSDRAAAPVRLPPTAVAEGGMLSVLASAAGAQPGNPTAAVALVRGLIASGDRTAAFGRAQALVQRNPGVPEAHLVVGDVEMLSGNVDGARAAYATAASLRFDEPTMLRLVESQEKSGRAADAAQTLALFLSQNPINVAALRLGARWQLASGEYDAAIDALEEVRFRTGNRDAALLAELAMAYTGAEDTDTARVYAAAAYRLAPGNPAVADAYGWTLSKADEPRAAVALLAKAATLAPDHAVIRWHLAQAYAATGNARAASLHARAALRDPNFTERREAEALAKG